MIVYALWNGGSSYRPGSLDDGDLERFPSMAAARQAFAQRSESRGWERYAFHYVDRPEESACLPSIDHATTSLTVYAYDPRESTDPYPSCLLTIGPRGGIVRDHC
jgi:hypothetical protein